MQPGRYFFNELGPWLEMLRLSRHTLHACTAHLMCTQKGGKLFCCHTDRHIRHTYNYESFLSFDITFLPLHSSQPSVILIQQGGFS